MIRRKGKIIITGLLTAMDVHVTVGVVRRVVEFRRRRRQWQRRCRLYEAGAGFSELEGESEETLFAAGGEVDRETGLVKGIGYSDEVEQALDRNCHSSDIPVVMKSPLTEESEHELEAVG